MTSNIQLFDQLVNSTNPVTRSVIRNILIKRLVLAQLKQPTNGS